MLMDVTRAARPGNMNTRNLINHTHTYTLCKKKKKLNPEAEKEKESSVKLNQTERESGSLTALWALLHAVKIQ